MNQAEAIFMVFKIWGSIGGLVAVFFLSFGMDRIDEDARGAYVFRPLLVPGILIIWPLVLWRWWLYEKGTEAWETRYGPPRKSHFWVGVILPVAIAAIITTGLMQRQSWPADIAPELLAAPAEVSQ